jgi:hypothetical protein
VEISEDDLEDYFRLDASGDVAAAADSLDALLF